MRAVNPRVVGGPEVLQSLGTRPGTAAHRDPPVRVAAAGVTPSTWKTRAGAGRRRCWRRRSPSLGRRRHGRRAAVGPGVTRFAVGDTVFGMPWFPRQAAAYAEFVTAPSRHFAHRPSRLDAVHAAALPLAGLTAWQCLVDIAAVQPGQRVLVHAAAGGVGHLAVQIAKSRGAHVIGTASSGKHDLLHDLGIDEAIDYRREVFEQVVEPVDLVCDLLGGDVALRSLDVLRPDGLMITLPSSTAAAATAAPRALRPRHARRARRRRARRARRLVERATCGDRGRDVPLERAALAPPAGSAGRTTGKLVLTT
jgi:NADPH:quinone reductase-like Zn-dependent oxidoreductase